MGVKGLLLPESILPFPWELEGMSIMASTYLLWELGERCQGETEEMRGKGER